MPLPALERLITGEHSDLSSKAIQSARLKLAREGCYIALPHDDNEILKIHHQLGHPSFRVTAQYCKANKIKVPSIDKLFCDACLKMKLRNSNRQQPSIATKLQNFPALFERFNCDVVGRFEPPSLIHGYQYILNIVCRNSNTLFSYPLKDLNRITQTFEHWWRDLTYTAHYSTQGLSQLPPVISMRLDSAAYFKSQQLTDFFARHSIKPIYSAPNRQDQNGYVERLNYTLLSRMKALLRASQLNNTYWAYAYQYVTLLHDFVPRAQEPSPREKRGLVPYNICKHLQPFGSKVYIYTKPTTKLKPSGTSGIYCGYNVIHKHHIVVIPHLNNNTERTSAQVRLTQPPDGYQLRASDTLEIEELPNEIRQTLLSHTTPHASTALKPTAHKISSYIEHKSSDRPHKQLKLSEETGEVESSQIQQSLSLIHI